MATTRLLVELLVIGLWGSLWAYPVATLVIPRSLAATLRGDPALILVLLLLLYSWGMIVNFLADQAFWFVDRLIARPFGGKERIQRLRAFIFVRSREAGEYLQQRRSMVRVHRATTFNCLCIILVLVLDVSGVRTLHGIALGPSILGLGLITGACFWAYVRTLRGYFAFVRDAGGVVDD